MFSGWISKLMSWVRGAGPQLATDAAAAAGIPAAGQPHRMTATMEARDWFVIVLTAVLWCVSTVYLFKHPSEGDFATWATLSGTVLTAYHWMVIWKRGS